MFVATVFIACAWFEESFGTAQLHILLTVYSPARSQHSFPFFSPQTFDSQLTVPHLTSLRKLGSVLLTTCLPSSLALTYILSSEWIIDALRLTATFCSILSPSPTADTPHRSTLCLNWLSHSRSWIMALVLSRSQCCCPPSHFNYRSV